MDFDLAGVLNAILLVVLPYLASLAFEGVKRASEFVQSLPAIVKQIAVVVIAAALGWLGQLLGTALPDTLAGITPEILETALGGVLTTLIYALAGKRRA